MGRCTTIIPSLFSKTRGKVAAMFGIKIMGILFLFYVLYPRGFVFFNSGFICKPNWPKLVSQTKDILTHQLFIFMYGHSSRRKHFSQKLPLLQPELWQTEKILHVPLFIVFHYLVAQRYVAKYRFYHLLQNT